MPARLVNSKMPLALDVVATLREVFQKDVAVDSEQRRMLAALMHTTAEAEKYSRTEDCQIERVTEKFARFGRPAQLRSVDGTRTVRLLSLRSVGLRSVGERSRRSSPPSDSALPADDKGGFLPLESKDVLVKAAAAYEEGNHHIVGRSETIVDASYETVAAWDSLVMSRYRTSIATISDLERSASSDNAHSQLFHEVLDLR